MRILEELWYSTIKDNRFLNNNTKFTEMLDLLSKNADNLMENLSEKEKETFEKYRDCNAEISQITELENFTNGFKMGVLMMIEVMKDSNGMR
ncbi:hypothetical protein HDR66_00310 [bacterium]|nr:hypothetical protein [bacterium]